MKTGRAIVVGVIGFAASSSVYADNLAEAATEASAWAKRPIAASPHALEEFPWALRGAKPPQPIQTPQTYPGNFAEIAAKASAWAKGPIAASPHALEEFPWVLRGYPPPTNAPSVQNKIESQR